MADNDTLTGGAQSDAADAGPSNAKNPAADAGYSNAVAKEAGLAAQQPGTAVSDVAYAAELKHRVARETKATALHLALEHAKAIATHDAEYIVKTAETFWQWLVKEAEKVA